MKIGAVTIGQSPRDDIIPEIREILGPGVEIIEAGALDGLSLVEVKDFYPESTDHTLVTRMKDGTEVKVAEKHIVPRLNNCILELEHQGADILMLLCTGEFPFIESGGILLRPDRIVGNVVKGILDKGRLGVIVPSPGQISAMKKKWGRANLYVVSEAVSPYRGTEKEIFETANKVKNFNVDLIVLDCMGFNKKAKAIFREVTQKPVLLPRTILGRIAREIVEVK
ncbi:MAG: AroM family protein [Candidatus Aminicenantes bacterium]|nr:AroM family protein [Candidatus Aminicenantes bacterium]NIM82067.1 AroM family protein [Candidatus Aminicenantes bacterium]NIN21465.1 AroM family protein [Candidatus Aminicenantes bacterium]NIN45277.1 AroM family protein [Candidatus Aminicenantes bacterium]NIN88094.1 AroM family protein [Candidatus Aminicenantes bacterium]